MYSVILCGGSGTRLWPLSRKNYPKQFLNLYGDKSLLQETFLRMHAIMPKENIFFVTNRENYFNVYNQIKELEPDYSKDQIIIEPKSLNTAPAITLSVKYLHEKCGIDLDKPVIFLPSDHYIKNKDNYLQLVTKAFQTVGDSVGTIGITPTHPHTGYGYIKKGVASGANYNVDTFKEKPDKETAKEYINSGQYVWNAGMYLFKMKTLLSELESHAPEMSRLTSQPLDIFIEKFAELPSISIDYAISEKSKNVVVYEGDFGWNDIGSFDSLAEMNSLDKSRHINIDSKNIYIHSETNRLVATVGVEDLVIVENRDSILVHKKGRGEDVKKVVDQLKEKGYKELEHNLIDHRPWGKFEILIDTPYHKVKRLTIYPQEKLSLQCHYHRAEHWVIVKGVARVFKNDEETLLSENESTFIPAMTNHSLENPGKINLEIIEVQTGSYLGEDDIIRFQDRYDRVKNS